MCQAQITATYSTTAKAGLRERAGAALEIVRPRAYRAAGSPW